MGGATSYDFSKAGAFSHRIVKSLLNCRRLGYPLSGSGDSGNWKMACIHSFGPNDQARILAGDPNYSAAAYTANSQSCFSLLRDYGYQGKIFVPKNTMLANAVSTALPGAQAAIIDNSKGIYLGSAPDGTHPTGTMVTAAMAPDWNTVINANY
jgi:hypothetical protein